MTETRTRVAALIAGKLRKLLAIKETSKGSLVITMSKVDRFQERFFTPDGGVDSVRKEGGFVRISQKYTVHIPRKFSPGNLVHHTLAGDGVSPDESYIDTLCIPNELVEPIYLNTFHDLDMDKSIVHPSTKDHTIVLTKCDAELYTLNIIVFLAPPRCTDQVIEDSPQYIKEIIHFRLFSLVILRCFSLLPSWGTAGLIIHFMTKGRVAGELGLGDASPPSNGYTPRLARGFAVANFMMAHQQQQLEMRHRGPPENWETIDNLYAAGLFPAPFPETDDHGPPVNVT